MPKRPRLLFAGAIYHVTARGNRKAAIFNCDGDRKEFLRIVAEAVSTFDARCLGYCLMGNHYHLVIETPRGNLSELMREINGTYAQWFNRQYGHWGHLFGARYSASVVQERRYLRKLARYLALNPVEGGLVRDAAAWEWSSYRATAGLEPVPGLLCTDWLELAFECASHSEAQRRYRLYVNDDTLAATFERSSLPVVGNREFQAHVRQEIGDAKLLELPRVYRTLDRPTLDQLFRKTEIPKQRRNQLIREAQQQWGYRLAEIASHLGIHPSTASLVVRKLKQSVIRPSER